MTILLGFVVAIGMGIAIIGTIIYISATNIKHDTEQQSLLDSSAKIIGFGLLLIMVGGGICVFNSY